MQCSTTTCPIIKMLSPFLNGIETWFIMDLKDGQSDDFCEVSGKEFAL